MFSSGLIETWLLRVDDKVTFHKPSKNCQIITLLFDTFKCILSFNAYHYNFIYMISIKTTINNEYRHNCVTRIANEYET